MARMLWRVICGIAEALRVSVESQGGYKTLNMKKNLIFLAISIFIGIVCGVVASRFLGRNTPSHSQSVTPEYFGWQPQERTTFDELSTSFRIAASKGGLRKRYRLLGTQAVTITRSIDWGKAVPVFSQDSTAELTINTIHLQVSTRPDTSAWYWKGKDVSLRDLVPTDTAIIIPIEEDITGEAIPDMQERGGRTVLLDFLQAQRQIHEAAIHRAKSRSVPNEAYTRLLNTARMEMAVRYPEMRVDTLVFSPNMDYTE